MANGNKRGPQNQGPKTGRGMGYCAGFNTPGYMNPGQGSGGGFGRGGGRGFGGYGYRHGATGMPGRQRGAMGMPPWDQGVQEPSQENELEFLKEQVQMHTDSLDEIRRRVDAMEKDK